MFEDGIYNPILFKNLIIHKLSEETHLVKVTTKRQKKFFKNISIKGTKDRRLRDYKKCLFMLIGRARG